MKWKKKKEEPRVLRSDWWWIIVVVEVNELIIDELAGDVLTHSWVFSAFCVCGCMFAFC